MVACKAERWNFTGQNAEIFNTWVELFRAAFAGQSSISGVAGDIIVVEGDLHWSEQKQRRREPDKSPWHHGDGGWYTLSTLWERTIIRQAMLRRLIAMIPLTAIGALQAMLEDSAHCHILRALNTGYQFVARSDPSSIGIEDVVHRWRICPRVDDDAVMSGDSARAVSDVSKGPRRQRSPSLC